MTFTAIASNPKATQLVEAKPGAWKQYASNERHFGTALKAVSAATFIATVLTGGTAPLVGFAFLAAFNLTGSGIKAMYKTAAENKANEAQASIDGGLPKQANFLKNWAQNALNPLF